MWEIMSIISVYILALIGLVSIVIIGIAIFFAYKYDINFTVNTGENKKSIESKGK